MKKFSKKEAFGVFIIFFFVLLITTVNLNISLRRARDAQRRGDIGIVSDALDKFFSEYGYFPLSDAGGIKMCKADNFSEILEEVKKLKQFDTELFFRGLKNCEWGKDGFADVLDPDTEPYLKTIPSDPYRDRGVSYYYISNTRRYQLYSILEGGKDEIGYNEAIVGRNLKCGNQICSYGKTYGVPLDRDISEYEEELLKKSGQ